MSLHRVACAALVALLFACLPDPRPVHAQAADSTRFLPIRGQRRVLIETRTGRLLTVKPIGILGDSLMLERPVARHTNGRFELAQADVARAFVHRKNPKTMALVFGATGFAGGALLELALGSRGQGFGHDVKHVFLTGGLNATVKLAVGALYGVLWPAWRQAIPPPGAADVPPFPAWNASALGGIAHPPAFPGSRTQPAISFASFKTMGPYLSFGYEYGSLTRESFHYHEGLSGGATNVAAFDEDVATHWAYSTLQFRVPLRRRGARPLLTFGFGPYYRGDAFRAVETDTAGVKTRFAGRDVGDALGGNFGVGVVWGHGPTRPDVELRYHGTHDSHWFTLAAGIAYP